MAYESSNPFGQGIPLREGQPIQLIRYEFGRIYVVPEALEILQQIREPVAVIAVVGSYRRGKSWFANVLHGRHDGFELGAQVNGCTRGIYMWDTPFTHKGERVIVLDTEGIDDPDQEAEWATKLFILCLVLSSTLVYNISGVVGSGDIGKLILMQDLSRHIQPPQDSDYLPHLVMLLRDFGLERPESLKEYFLNTLAQSNREAAEGIKRSFKEFSVYALPHPGVGNKDLRQMQSIDTGSLEEEFIEETTKSVKDIFKRLGPKHIDYLKMNGLAFTDFLVQCVAKMNDTDCLSIPDEYETVIQNVAHKMKDECLRLYQADMTDLANSTPMLWEEFNAKHQDIFASVVREYVGSLIGSLKQIEGFKENFQQEIDNVKLVYYEKNSKELYESNLGKASVLWNQLVKPGLNVNQLFTEAEFRQAITNFEKQYAEHWVPSPEAMEVLRYFKENQYKTAIDALADFNVVNEKLATEMKEREKLQEKFLEITQREMRLRNYLAERDQQAQSIQEAVNAKNEEIQQAIRKRAETGSSVDKARDETQKAIEDLKAKHEQDMAKMREELEEAKKSKEDYLQEIGVAIVTTLVRLVTQYMDNNHNNEERRH